jgi:CDP-4-dehydro-6-deoxyglucose reductase, E1
MNYPLTQHEFDEKDLKNIIDLFTDQTLTMGANVRAFETEVSSYHARRYGVMFNSGSSANLVLIASLVLSGRLSRGDKIVVPAVSWSTTFFPLVQYGLVPVFVDVDIDSWTMDPELCRHAIKDIPGIRAVFFVSLLGSFTNYKKIVDLCVDNSLILLVDNCEGFGSKFFDGREAALCGVESIGMSLSFFYSHQLPAIEGGMVLTDDEELFHYMLSLRAHGWTRELPSSKYLDVDQNEFTSLFRFVLPGYCLRPMEINAVLGRERLSRWKLVSEVRRDNHKKYLELFAGDTSISVQHAHDGQSAFGFGMLMPSAEKRETLIDLCKKAGIQCRPVVAGNFLNNPVCKRIDFEVYGDFYCADLVDDCGVFFGNTGKPLGDQLILLQSVLRECLR